MIIDCISDLHGYYPDLEGGDLLIVAGDLTANDESDEYDRFSQWIQKQNYIKKVVIAGNHDSFIQICPEWTALPDLGFEYLCDSGTEFKGMKIWGSPWTLTPYCMTFTCDTEKELAAKWALIPPNTDILITHGPPYGLADKTIDGRHVGSKSLQTQAFNLNLKLWVTGHIHAAYGIETPGHLYKCTLLNASHVNEDCQPVNKPIRVIL